MSLAMILSRMGRNRRVLLVLLLAMSLVSAFFALGPLYLRSMGDAALRYTIDTTPASAFNLRLNNTEPTDWSNRAILDQELGGFAKNVERITHSAGTFCFPTVGVLCFGGEARQGYLPVALSTLRERVTLVQGRFPQPGIQPAEVEAVLTTRVAQQARLEIGDRFILNQPDPTLLTIVIVGLVDPVDADDPFWDQLNVVVNGQLIDVTENFQRFDFGMIVDEDIYDDLLAPVGRSGSLYQWYIESDTGALRAGTLANLTQSLDRALAQFRLRYQFADLTGDLFGVIARFQASVSAAEAPVILLSSGVLLLMLFQLVTTVALILEQESLEWAAITSRGGSLNQLIRMQFMTMSILGVCAFVIGLILAPLVLVVLEHVGPLSAITGDAPLALEAPPTTSVILSLTASLIAVLLLTLPAYPAARSSILRLKQSVSRPPTRPAWARFYLDALLLILGFALLVRLYFLVGGDAGQGLGALIADPASLIRILASNPSSGLLTDPFNMIGAALLLVGVALLWLRVFPLLMRAAAALLFRRLNSLLVPLAIWSVERDPSHYAQLVLLLIGTLALGTAALALNVTHDAGAWEVAAFSTGGSASIQFDPPAYDSAFDPRALPGVTDAATLMKYTASDGRSEVRYTLFGVDPNSDLPAVAPLAQFDTPPRSGITLPLDAVEVALHVYAELSGDGKTVQTRLALDLEDAIGVRRTVPMTAADETLTGAFHEYRATLPADAYLPWRVVAVRLLSRVDTQGGFAQSLFIDNLSAINAAGSVTILEDFERLAVPEWMSSNAGGLSNPTGLFATATSAHAAAGTYSLRVDYGIAQNGALMSEPLLVINRAVGASNPIPVIVSQEFADYAVPRAERRASALVGDEGTLTLRLPQRNLDLHYRIVGIIRDFPTMTAQDRFLIADMDTLRSILNSIATPENYYTLNQAWLTLDTREPSADFERAAAAAPGFVAAVYASERYNELRREPLPNAITGMLFAGFWVSLGLGLLDFGFYLAMTARRRATSFAVLRALGWNAGKVWGLLTIEQATLVAPALVVGAALGAGLAYLLLPFLALLGGESLRLPLMQIAGLLLALVIGFAVLLGVTAVALQRMSINQVLRQE